MSEQVLLAVSSWSLDKSDGGTFVALPVACSDCTIRSTDMPFADCDPYQRGLLMFLLAGVREPDELGGLLGITDLAFVDLMASELERRGMLRRSGGRELVPTQRVIDTYRAAPGTTTHQIFGRVLYRHDGTRGYVIVGPLDLQARIETIDVNKSGSGMVSIGTEGKPILMPCLVPEIPQKKPAPIAADDAQRGIASFARTKGTELSLTPRTPREHFTVVLEEPRWERLLVRLVTLPSDRHRGKSDAEAFIAPGVTSPHALTQAKLLASSHPQLKRALTGAKADRKRQDPRDEPTRQPRDDQPEATSGLSTEATTIAEVTEVPAVVSLSLTAQLERTLSHRASMRSAGAHVPLVNDHPTNDATLRERFRHVGFATINTSGEEIHFPLIPGGIIDHIRDENWMAFSDLWAAFSVWALMEEDGDVKSLATYIPDLPERIAEAHWGHHDHSNDELKIVLDELEKIGRQTT